MDKGSWEMPPKGHPSGPTAGMKGDCCERTGNPGSTPKPARSSSGSKAFESWGLDPLPHYVEPPQSPVSTPELYKKYPLIMITGARSLLFFHSEHRMIPWLREKEPGP